VSALSLAAVTLLASTCQHVVAPSTIVGIAQHESGLDPARVHLNTDGTRDRGLMQINERNDAWLGLTDPFNPCQSIRAAADLLASFSRYNSGSPTRSLPYALAVSARVDAVRGVQTSPRPIPATEAEADLTDQPADNGGETVFAGN
jgi:soluble lytic murein transglycosylase-like protein